MANNYIIFEDGVHAEVFLVEANSEKLAWKLYLERQWEYVEQGDGTYRHKIRHHVNLDDVFGIYGITSHSDGSYSDVHGSAFSSLEEVKSLYGIEEQADETFISRDKAYANLAEARCRVAGHHHVEIALCLINPLSLFQTLFVSRDKWEYAQLDTVDEIKSDIITQHLWQATRYESIGQVKEAVAELKKALRLTSEPREKLNIFLEVGRLCGLLNQLPEAAKQYTQALQLVSEYDNYALIRYGLAEVYQKMGLTSKALWHYRQVPVGHLDEGEEKELEKRIAELEQTDRATKTA